MQRGIQRQAKFGFDFVSLCLKIAGRISRLDQGEIGVDHDDCGGACGGEQMRGDA